MRYCDDRQFVLLLKTMDQFVDVLLTRFIEAGSGFIEQEYIWFALIGKPD